MASSMQGKLLETPYVLLDDAFWKFSAEDRAFEEASSSSSYLRLSNGESVNVRCCAASASVTILGAVAGVFGFVLYSTSPEDSHLKTYGEATAYMGLGVTLSGVSSLLCNICVPSLKTECFGKKNGHWSLQSGLCSVKKAREILLDDSRGKAEKERLASLYLSGAKATAEVVEENYPKAKTTLELNAAIAEVGKMIGSELDIV